MALPSSGALSLANIQTEFGGSNPISLNEYYAGGAYVPAGTSGTYGAVPSSGAISIRNFYGTSKIYTYSGTMTQGIDTSGSFTGYGFVRGSAGSISPDDTTITTVYKFFTGTQWYLSVTFAVPGGTTQNYWTTLTLGGTFSINSSAATAFLNGNTWEFAGTNPAPLTGSGTTSLVFS